VGATVDDVVVIQEPVRRRLGPVAARLRDARPGLVRQLLGQQHRPPVQPRVAKLHRLEFFFGPLHRRLSLPDSAALDRITAAPRLCVMRWVMGRLEAKNAMASSR
jgi:hypothetical protein